MLRQTSDRIMHHKLPLDLNMQSPESGNLQPDLKQLQAQMSGAATHAFLLDTYSMNGAVPAASPSMARVAGVLHPAINFQGAYAYPFEAAYDPFLPDHQHHHQPHQKMHHRLPIHQQQQSHVRVEPVSYTHLSQQRRRQQLEERGCWFPNWQEFFDGFALPREEKDFTLSSFEQQFAKQDVSTVPSLAIAAGSTDVRRTNVQADGDEIIDLERLSSPLAKQDMAPPHATVAELHNGGLDRAEADCRDSGNLSSPHSRGNVACNFITQSPAWLPPGWITEVQTRRSGATAGTRDKYYKELVSGRRFRSRNEVIHYLQTGKGRLRWRRRKKATASATIECYGSYLTHQPRTPADQQTFHPCLMPAPRPIEYVPAPPMITRTNTSLPSIPRGLALDEETACQSPAPNANVSSTGDRNQQSEEQISQIPMFGMKQLPVYEKADITSPNKLKDKQASRIYQWLQRSDEQPQKQLSILEEQNTLGRDTDRDAQIDQKKSQICKDIEMAQKTIVQLGKTLHATVEKLTQRVQTGKEDLKLEALGFQNADEAANNVMQATSRLDGAVVSLTEAVQSLVAEVSSTIRVSQVPISNMGMTSSSAKQSSPAAFGVAQRALRPDMSTVQLPSSSCKIYAARGIDHAPSQTQEFPLGLRGVSTSEALSTNACTHYSRVSSSWLANCKCDTQAVQLPDILEPHSIQQPPMPEVSMSDTAKIPEASVIFADYLSTQATATVFFNSEKLSGCQYASKNATESKTQMLRIHKFPALNPVLDLSLLRPNLSSRQRAKAVQKMKARHVRGFLVTLGRKLCDEAISKNSKKC